MNNRRRRLAKARRADAQQPVRNGNHIAELRRVRDGLREIYERLNRRHITETLTAEDYNARIRANLDAIARRADGSEFVDWVASGDQKDKDAQ